MILPNRASRAETARWLLAGAVVALLVYAAVAGWLVLNRSPVPSLGSPTAVVYAAGDLADGGGGAGGHVAAMLSRHNFDALLTLGDHAGDFRDAEEFAERYAPAYAAYDERVRPTPGDMDYADADATAYFDYFDRHSRNFPGEPYYAFSLGGWRMYSLNSEIGQPAPGTEMYEWLRAELAADASNCILAYWHRPTMTVSGKASPDMALIWGLLAAHGADIVLTAHERNYQRWGPVDGITSFVIGTGGGARDPIVREDHRLEVADDVHDGALELTLTQRGARYAFRSSDDVVNDSGQLTCSPRGSPARAPGAPTGLRVDSQADGAKRLTWEAPSDATGVIGYVVLRGGDLLGYTADTSFDDVSLAESSGVLYSVRAVNAAGLRSPAAPWVYSAADAIGFSGRVWSPLDRNPASPTLDKPQSKLWFADDTWWGLLYTDGEADGVASGYYIHRLEAESQTMTNTEILVDPRDRSHADALWDERRSRVYIVSTIDSGAIHLYRFDYARGQYRAATGFPVELSEHGAESATIAQTSDGRLWVTTTQAADGSGRCVETEQCHVYSMHSTTADSVWAAPVAVPVEGAEVSADDISSVVVYGDDNVGILWSNQLDGSFRFASHQVGNSETDWADEALVVSPRAADDHLNVKTDDSGRVYFVGKTSLNDPANAPEGTPLVTVWVREPTGAWRNATAWTVADDVTRPQLMVDPVLGRLAVVAAQPGGGGSIYVKTAAIETLTFEPGLGTPLMVGLSLNNPTTTKQHVDLTGGAVVLAADTASHTYWHASVSVER